MRAGWDHGLACRLPGQSPPEMGVEGGGEGGGGGGGGGAGLTRVAGAARDPGRCYRPAGGSYDGAEAAGAGGGRLKHQHHRQQQRHCQHHQLHAHPCPPQQVRLEVARAAGCVGQS